MKDQKRIKYFINCFSNKNEKKQKDNLEYITYKREENNIHIVYKTRKKDVFYLIIYRRELNINLPYIVLKDCIAIIRKYKKNQLKNIKIIPIVIYLKEHKSFYNKLIHPYFDIATYDNHILKLKYNLIHLSNLASLKKIQNTILEELIFVEELKQTFNEFLEN